MSSPLPNKLAAPARRALASAHVDTLDDLRKLSEAQVKKMHGMGPNAMRILREAMEAAGVDFERGKRP